MNPNIDTAYWWLTASTVPLWVWAFACNFVAARHGVIEGVKIRAASATLALIYLAATLLLLFSDLDPAGWSDVLRGLQWITIPVVWVAPARWSVRVAERIRETDRKVSDRYDGEM